MNKNHYINIREDLFRWSCSSMVERGPYKAGVVGSNPTKTTKETLYPLSRMGSGYSNSSNKCCGCTATETVERTGCKPDDGTEEQGLNKNQEGNDLDIGKLIESNSDREPALGGAAPAKKSEDGEG